MNFVSLSSLASKQTHGDLRKDCLKKIAVQTKSCVGHYIEEGKPCGQRCADRTQDPDDDIDAQVVSNTRIRRSRVRVRPPLDPNGWQRMYQLLCHFRKLVNQCLLANSEKKIQATTETVYMTTAFRPAFRK